MTLKAQWAWWMSIVGVGLLLVPVVRHLTASCRPKLLFDTAEYNAGVLRDQNFTAINWECRFRNAGDAALEIRDIRSTCGCTIVDRDRIKRAYAPGEMGVIPLRLFLTNLGEKSADVLVASNAPGSPHTIKIGATFEPPSFATTVPAKVSIGPVGRGSEKTGEVTVDVLLRSDAEVKVASLTYNRDMWKVALKQTSRLSMKSPFGYYNTRFIFDIISLAKVAGEFSDVVQVNFTPEEILHDLRVMRVQRSVSPSP